MKLLRTASGLNTTLGELYINERFQCYILENTVRDTKILGATAIPEGKYELGFNATAGMNANYANRYPQWHQGMIEVRAIPDFSLVFFHIGNYHTDTRGCLLTGSYYQLIDHDYRVLHSAAAYKRVYPLLAEAIASGDAKLEILNRMEERRVG
ncbi:hypothetical protein H8S90_10615 [Olivibacter sp. SDN3]|uniref:DUF5675 family protein n=1 Tax=Olivibacter sp. SDN3 TaxID=2764720 RepID=UPI00165146E5|nr:DUF5675 family protein [Olivibacter sp. SDN3]QNL51980.1 hypothetical protein H8S90_10615 [Olivibacter sp. SDN3]